MRYQPHPYQQICADHLEQTPKAALFLDCGMGKTVITETYIADLIYNQFKVKRCLVIAPKKVAEDTWTNEQKKWDHLDLLTFSKVLGTKEQRLKALEADADIYLINREMVSWLVSGFTPKTWPFDMVVVDELSSFKSSKSQRFKDLAKIIRSGKVNYFLGLTGTPQPRGIEDLWSEIFLVDGGQRLGRSMTAFHDRYFTKALQSRFDPKTKQKRMYAEYEPLPDAEAQIHKAIEDIAISLSADDWLNVPGALYIYHEIELSKEEQAKVNRFTRTKVFNIDEKDIKAETAAVVAGKLLQIANGALYDEDKQTHRVHNKKIESLVDLVEQANQSPVMIFYWFQHDREAIKKALKDYSITELETSKEREDWNKKKYDIALVHPASMGHGLNLQDGGNIIIWFSMTFDLEIYQQANARLHRQGQKQKVLIHHLVCKNTYDEEAIARLQSKDGSQQRLIERLKADIKKAKEKQNV